MALHPWWAGFGLPVPATDALPVPSARVFAKAVEAGLPGVTLIDLKHAPETGRAAVHIEAEVERPQDLAYPISAVEPIAVVFEQRNIRPSILALREDFPDTMHQNGVPPDTPCSLCVDDRPWPESGSPVCFWAARSRSLGPSLFVLTFSVQ